MRLGDRLELEILRGESDGSSGGDKEVEVGNLHWELLHGTPTPSSRALRRVERSMISVISSGYSGNWSLITNTTINFPFTSD